MAERKLRFAHVEAGAEGVDRHPHLAAKAGSKREARLSRGGREGALARERLAGFETPQEPDQLLGAAPCDPQAAAVAFLERGDDEVGVFVQQRRQVSAEIGVAEEQPAGLRLALGEAQRLALSQPREAHHARARALGCAGGPVAGAVVGDEHLGFGECRAKRSHGLRDRPFLVAGGDEDGERLTHVHRVPETGKGGSGWSAVALRPYWAGGAPASSSTRASRPSVLSRSSTLESPELLYESTADFVASVGSTPTAGTPGAARPSYSPSTKRLVAPCCGDAVRVTITPSIGCRPPPTRSSTSVSVNASQRGVSPPNTSSSPRACPSAPSLPRP